MVDASLGFSAEQIPNSDSVFMRAHRIHFRNGGLEPGVFKAHGGGMSVDWEKYSTPEQTQQRGKNAQDNAVLVLQVGDIRAIKGLDVNHRPIAENRAHSDVTLPEKREELVETRMLLKRVAKIAIPIDSNLEV